MEYRVWVGTMELAPEAPVRNLVDALIDRLSERPEVSDVVGWGEDRCLGVLFSVDAPDIASAGTVGMRAAEAALAAMDHLSPVVRLEVEQVIEAGAAPKVVATAGQSRSNGGPPV